MVEYCTLPYCPVQKTRFRPVRNKLDSSIDDVHFTDRDFPTKSAEYLPRHVFRVWKGSMTLVDRILMPFVYNFTTMVSAAQ